jgi:hypothetical protein
LEVDVTVNLAEVRPGSYGLLAGNRVVQTKRGYDNQLFGVVLNDGLSGDDIVELSGLDALECVVPAQLVFAFGERMREFLPLGSLSQVIRDERKLGSLCRWREAPFATRTMIHTDEVGEVFDNVVTELGLEPDEADVMMRLTFGIFRSELE